MCIRDRYTAAVYPVQRVVYTCHSLIPGISLRHCYCCLLGTPYRSCLCRGYVIIELAVYLSRMNSQRRRWVCWKSKTTCWKSGLIPNTYTRYHICLIDAYGVGVLQDVVGVWSSYCCLSGTTCVPVIVQCITTSLLLLSTSYFVQRFITACVVVTQAIFDDGKWQDDDIITRCNTFRFEWNAKIRWGTVLLLRIIMWRMRRTAASYMTSYW